MFSIQFEVDLLVLLREDANGFLAIRVRLHSGNRLVGKRLNLDEPLQGKPRLDDGFAAVAMADVVRVVLDSRQQPLRFKIRNNLLARNKAVQARIGAALGC